MPAIIDPISAKLQGGVEQSAPDAGHVMAVRRPHLGHFDRVGSEDGEYRPTAVAFARTCSETMTDRLSILPVALPPTRHEQRNTHTIHRMLPKWRPFDSISSQSTGHTPGRPKPRGRGLSSRLTRAAHVASIANACTPCPERLPHRTRDTAVAAANRHGAIRLDRDRRQGTPQLPIAREVHYP